MLSAVVPQPRFSLSSTMKLRTSSGPLNSDPMRSAKPTDQSPLDIFCEVRQGAVEILVGKGLKGSTHNLHLLLRHRLLPQPGGFEGLLTYREEFASERLAVAHRPQMSGSVLHHRATAPWSGAPSKEHNDLVATFEELFWLDDHFLERLKHLVVEPLVFLGAAICTGERVTVGHLQFEVGMHPAKDPIPVSTADRLVSGAKRLKVCLRHRPPSIPLGLPSANGQRRAEPPR